MSGVDLLVAVAATLILATGSWFAFRMGVKNWRAFKGGIRRPILHHVPAHEVAVMRREWPVYESRWPNPWEAPRMHPSVAAAYARLAERSKLASSLTSQALVVVSGAWLSLTLVPIWMGIQKSMEEGRREYAAGAPLDLFRWEPDIYLPLLPALFVALALGLMMRAHEYERLQAAYEKASLSGPHERRRRRRRRHRLGDARRNILSSSRVRGGSHQPK